MKIALLIRRYIMTGGAERYAVEVARRLAKSHEVHVLAQQWDHEPKGMTLHRVPLLSEKPRAFNQWWFSWQTSRMVRRLEPDVVYTHERVTQFDVMNIHCGTFVGGLWGPDRNKSAFRTWLKVTTDPSIWAYWLLEKRHNQPARGRYWVADSNMVKLEVQQYYRIPDDRFFIAHSGVDQPSPDAAEARTLWRQKLGFKNEDVVVLFVASEFRRKGLPALVEAMGLLKNRAPKLVIVGGEDRTEYEARARELGVESQLTWAGRVSNVKDYYALSDVFVLPTLSDPSPVAPLEAMAHGCAAIVSSSRYTGVAELAANGEAILLQDPKSPVEIAAALERLIDPSTRGDYAEKGRQLVRKLSWDRTAAQILVALEKSREELRRVGSLAPV